MDIEQLDREHYHIVYGYLLSLCGDRTAASMARSGSPLRATGS